MTVAISTNVFAMLFQSSLSLLYGFPLCVSVSACLTLWHCFDMGAESRDRCVYNRPGHASLEVMLSITTDPGTVIEQRHVGGSFLFTSFKTCMLSFH